MKRTRTIRVMLADDHPVVLAGVRTALMDRKNIQVVGEAANGKEVLEKAKELLPDVVLMDINMPTVSGLEATRQLKKILPRVKVLAFTMHDDREYILEILKSGATGYILKETSPAELVKAIESVHHGGAFFSPSASRVLLEHYMEGGEKGGTYRHELTGREAEVLNLIAEGYTSKEIADKLSLSARTIETYRTRIMEKLNLHNIAELTRYALTRGVHPSR